MRKPFLLLSALLLNTLLMGQDAKQDFADGEFFLVQEDYEEALFTYQKVYANGYEDNANINYRIGMCLLEIPGRRTESIPYLEKAVMKVSEKYKEGNLKETTAPIEAHLFLGNAYRINHEFEKAREQYMVFKNYVGDDDDIRSFFADQQIVSCTNAVAAMNNPVDVKIGNLGQINQTHTSTYNWVVSKDLKTVAYMGRNPFYNGIYVSRKVDGIWGRPLGINASVVSEGNMDVVGLSSHGDTMLLVVSDAFESNIYESVYSNERWNPAESLGKPVNSKFYESHAAFSPDGNTVYFTSNRNESLGAMDIFSSKRQADGSWSMPMNLGENINTLLNEEAPVVSPTGRRLYFASQGHETIGGFDIFYSDRNADGTWGKAVNLGFPLNSTDDDFTLSLSGFDQDGFQTLYSSAGKDKYPLYRFEIIGQNATAQVVPFDEPPEEEQVTEVLEEQAEEPVEEVKTPAEPVKAPPVIPKAPETYLINPVFFDFDSYALTAEAKEVLNKIGYLLNQFQDLEVEISGHTDDIGSVEYNQRLSLNRAKAVKDYLVSSGIHTERISISGKSESEPVARNRTTDQKDAPEGRKLNRRVQFKVNVTEGVIVKMQPIQVPDYLKLND